MSSQIPHKTRSKSYKLLEKKNNILKKTKMTLLDTSEKMSKKLSDCSTSIATSRSKNSRSRGKVIIKPIKYVSFARGPKLVEIIEYFPKEKIAKLTKDEKKERSQCGCSIF